MNISLSLSGGLGDFILKYLGFPGNRLAEIQRIFPNQVLLRVSDVALESADLLTGSPYFSKIETFKAIPLHRAELQNDVSNINDIHLYNKITPPLWLSDEEEEIFNSINKPYAVMHPSSSEPVRDFKSHFDVIKLMQWVADTSGIPLIVLDKVDYNYKSKNVYQIKGSSRLAVKLVQHASFFIGTHSSMCCASWIYNVPSFCMGPSHLLFHGLYAPDSFREYLKPLFKNKNLFMFFDQDDKFAEFFDHFLLNSTSLKPLLCPSEYHNKIIVPYKAL